MLKAWAMFPYRVSRDASPTAMGDAFCLAVLRSVWFPVIRPASIETKLPLINGCDLLTRLEDAERANILCDFRSHGFSNAILVNCEARFRKARAALPVERHGPLLSSSFCRGLGSLQEVLPGIHGTGTSTASPSAGQALLFVMVTPNCCSPECSCAKRQMVSLASQLCHYWHLKR